ncbi:Transposon Ty3-G Gag-Pol poly, partial [Paramuricea clavata]
MAHLNVASLPKHIDELRLQLTKQSLDILSINETRLDNTINDGLIHLNGYDVLRKDRNRMGGGIAIYFRDNINIKNRNDLVPDSLEALCVEVRKPKSKPILIVSCYRPPNSNHEVLKLNENLIKKLDNEEKEIVILFYQ